MAGIVMIAAGSFALALALALMLWTMPPGYEPSRVALSQVGNLHLNGGNLFDVAEVVMPQAVVFTIGKGATSNICLVTIQLQDGPGANIANVTGLDVWLSDAATGIGLTATTASGAVGAGASGTDLGVLTTKKANHSITDATGKYVLSITDTAKTAFYVACKLPFSGKVAVSRVLATGDYD
jgi:hypothetical protein